MILLIPTLVLIAQAATTTPKMPAAIKTKPVAVAATLAKVNGEITEIGGNYLMVDGKRINIQTNTILLRKFGAKSTPTEFNVKDEVQVIGKWADANKTSVDARLIRNLSIQKRKGTFIGTIKNVTTTGFVFEPLNRPAQTVTVNNRTRYVNRASKAIKLTDLAESHKVQVKGMWDSKLNTISEVTAVKDFSIPAPVQQQTETQLQQSAPGQ